MGNIKLGEAAAEGYHRGTRLDKLRAESSTREKLIAAQRETQCFKRGLNWIEKRGPAGRRAFRYEWANFKRLLQTGEERRKLQRRKLMTDQEFFKQMYRMDNPAQLEWHNLFAKPKKEDNSLPSRDAVRVEYLQQVLQPPTTFGYERHAGDGPEEGPKWSYFHVLQLRTSRSRPKVTKTAESSTDPHLHSALSILIQEYDARVIDEEEEGPRFGDVLVFPCSDPAWRTWEDLAPFEVLRKRLQKWKEMVAADDAGCYWLRGMERAVPHVPLMDERCSSLVLVEQLHVKGWTAVSRTCVHTACPGRRCPGCPERVYDGREAVKQKYYYQVIHCMPDSFRYCATVPSTEPMSFYKAILKKDCHRAL